MAEKEYIEREAAIRAILGQPPEPHYPEWYYQDIKEIPAADVAPVVHGERKFGGLDFDGVDETLKKHRAFVMATIDGHGCHIGTA